MRCALFGTLVSVLCALAASAASAQETASLDASAAAPVAVAPTEIQLPVPAVTIYPGETITEASVLDRPFAAYVAERYPVVTARKPLIGKVAKRTLLPGNPIPNNAVEDAKLVTRGVAAQVRFVAGGLRIVGLGMPLESGALGAMVRVKNIDSGRTVSGVVQQDGSVRVGEQ
jgi:flagellar basal body P-ring formation protein FlgA